MLENNSKVRIYMITVTFVIMGAILVIPISGFPEGIQLIPVNNLYLDQLFKPAQNQVNFIPESVLNNEELASPIEDQAILLPDEDKPIQERENPLQDQGNQMRDKIILELDQSNLVQNQIKPELIVITTEPKDILELSSNEVPKAFDLSNDEAVNNLADVIEEDASIVFVNKDSINQQTKLDKEIENMFLREDDNVDLNLNYFDYMYLMDNKENTNEGENANKKKQGIDDLFYIKPLALFPKTQKLSDDSLNNFFDEKVLIDGNAIDYYSQYGQQVQPANDVARIQIITFFEETPETFEQNQGHMNIDYHNNFEIPSHEIEKQISITKSRISLFVFGWMFMVTGIALSCFMVIVSKRAASKRTLKVKKFSSPGEQPYHALGSEV